MRSPRRAGRALLGGLAGLAGVLALAVIPQAARGATTPMTPALVAAEVAPAVQLVQVNYAGTVVVPRFRERTAVVRAATDQLREEQSSGQIGSSLQAINDQWATLLASDPDRYLRPTGRVRSFPIRLAALCTGWFATPTGYLVTAAHCVARSDVLSDLAASARAAYIPVQLKATFALWHRQGVPLDAIISAELQRAVTRWYSRHAAVTAAGIRAQVALTVGGQGGTLRHIVVPAAVVASGTPYPGQDFALLKVSGQSHLPSLALGSSAGLSVGDNLYIDGFPGTVASDTFFSIASRLQPTFTDGLLSAFRTTTRNIPYLQTQAPAYHGNSGGPVLDSAGRVIGILIAGSVDQSSGQIVAGEQFVLPSAVLARLLAAHGVRAVASPATSDYVAALRNYDRGYYTAALAGFRQVLAVFPRQAYAARYVALARQQIAAGHDRTPAARPGGPNWAAGALALAVFLFLALIVAIVVVLVLRSRRRLPPAPPAGIGSFRQ